jgi:hypothetical protein
MLILVVVLESIVLAIVVVASVSDYGYRTKSEQVGAYKKTFWD